MGDLQEEVLFFAMELHVCLVQKGLMCQDLEKLKKICQDLEQLQAQMLLYTNRGSQQISVNMHNSAWRPCTDLWSTKATSAFKIACRFLLVANSNLTLCKEGISRKYC